MGKKLTLKKVAAELETVRTRVVEVEQGIEKRMAPTLKKLKQVGGDLKRGRFGGAISITPEQRQRMIEMLARMHSQRPGGENDEQNWYDAETEVRKIEEILRDTGDR